MAGAVRPLVLPLPEVEAETMRWTKRNNPWPLRAAVTRANAKGILICGGIGRRGSTRWWRNARMIGSAMALDVTSLVETFHFRKTSFCLATSLSRLLMLPSAVRGLRLIATSRRGRGARDLSCSHGGDCAARKVRASASEVKGGGGYGHPLTHGPVFQRDNRIIERLGPETLLRSNPHAEVVRAAQEFRSRSLPFSN